MINRKRKGFTIVELVIVIAVVAILAAVLIPTFASIINRANQSADIQAVRQMNMALAAASVTKQPEEFSLEEAVLVLADAGYNSEDTLIPVTKDHRFFWCKGVNLVVLVKSPGDPGERELIYPTDNEKINENFKSNFDLDLAPEYAVFFDLGGENALSALDLNPLEKALMFGNDYTLTDPTYISHNITYASSGVTIDLNGHDLGFEDDGELTLASNSKLNVVDNATNGIFVVGNENRVTFKGDASLNLDVTAIVGDEAFLATLVAQPNVTVDTCEFGYTTANDKPIQVAMLAKSSTETTLGVRDTGLSFKQKYTVPAGTTLNLDTKNTDGDIYDITLENAVNLNSNATLNAVGGGTLTLSNTAPFVCGDGATVTLNSVTAATTDETLLKNFINNENLQAKNTVFTYGNGSIEVNEPDEGETTLTLQADSTISSEFALSTSAMIELGNYSLTLGDITANALTINGDDGTLSASDFTAANVQTAMTVNGGVAIKDAKIDLLNKFIDSATHTMNGCTYNGMTVSENEDGTTMSITLNADNADNADNAGRSILTNIAVPGGRTVEIEGSGKNLTLISLGTVNGILSIGEGVNLSSSESILSKFLNGENLILKNGCVFGYTTNSVSASFTVTDSEAKLTLESDSATFGENFNIPEKSSLKIALGVNQLTLGAITANALTIEGNGTLDASGFTAANVSAMTVKGTVAVTGTEALLGTFLSSTAFTLEDGCVFGYNTNSASGSFKVTDSESTLALESSSTISSELALSGNAKIDLNGSTLTMLNTSSLKASGDKLSIVDTSDSRAGVLNAEEVDESAFVGNIDLNSVKLDCSTLLLTDLLGNSSVTLTDCTFNSMISVSESSGAVDITLLADTADLGGITIANPTNVNLSNKTLKATSDFTVGAKLTVTGEGSVDAHALANSSSVEVINATVNTDTPLAYAVAQSGNANVTFSGCTFANGDYKLYANVNKDGVNLTYDSTVSAEEISDDATIDLCEHKLTANSISNSGYLTVKNGALSILGEDGSNYYGILNNDDATFELSNCSLSVSGKYTDIDYNSGSGIYNNGTLNIKTNIEISGSFSNGIYNSGTATLENVIIGVTEEDAYGIYNYGTATLGNSTINVVGDNSVGCYTYWLCPVDMSNVVITVEGEDAIGVKNGDGTVTLENTNVTVTGSGAKGIYNPMGTVTLGNTNISVTGSSAYGVYNHKQTFQSTLTLENTNVTVTGSGASGVYNYKGTVEIEGGIFKAAGENDSILSEVVGCLISDDLGTIEMVGITVIAKAENYHNDLNKPIYAPIYTNAGELDIQNSSISSNKYCTATYGIGKGTITTDAINAAGGSTFIYGEGCGFNYCDNGEVACTHFKPADGIATLLDNIIKGSGSGNIALSRDDGINAPYSISGAITIDLKGHKLTLGSSTNLSIMGGSLVITDSVGGGSIDVKLSGPSSSNSAFQVLSGSFAINGNTISGISITATAGTEVSDCSPNLLKYFAETSGISAANCSIGGLNFDRSGNDVTIGLNGGTLDMAYGKFLSVSGVLTINGEGKVTIYNIINMPSTGTLKLNNLTIDDTGKFLQDVIGDSGKVVANNVMFEKGGASLATVTMTDNNVMEVNLSGNVSFASTTTIPTGKTVIINLYDNNLTSGVMSPFTINGILMLNGTGTVNFSSTFVSTPFTVSESGRVYLNDLTIEAYSSRAEKISSSIKGDDKIKYSNSKVTGGTPETTYDLNNNESPSTTYPTNIDSYEEIPFGPGEIYDLNDKTLTLGSGALIEIFSSLSINGGNINALQASSNVFKLNGGTLSITNATINCTEELLVALLGNAKVTLTNCTFNFDVYSVTVNKNSTKISITLGGDVTFSEPYTFPVATEINLNGNTLTLESLVSFTTNSSLSFIGNGSITASNSGVFMTNGTFSVAEGIDVMGTEIILGQIIESAKVNVSIASFKFGEYTVRIEKTSAKATVTLLSDVTLIYGFDVPQNCPLTFALGGKKLDLTGLTVNNLGKLSITGSGTLTAGGESFSSSRTLHIENVTLTDNADLLKFLIGQGTNVTVTNASFVRNGYEIRLDKADAKTTLTVATGKSFVLNFTINGKLEISGGGNLSVASGFSIASGSGSLTIDGMTISGDADHLNTLIRTGSLTITNTTFKLGNHSIALTKNDQGVNIGVTANTVIDSLTLVGTTVININSGCTLTVNKLTVGGALRVEGGGTLSIGAITINNTVSFGGVGVTCSSDILNTLISNGDVTITESTFKIGDNTVTVTKNGDSVELNIDNRLDLADVTFTVSGTLTITGNGTLVLANIGDLSELIIDNTITVECPADVFVTLLNNGVGVTSFTIDGVDVTVDGTTINVGGSLDLSGKSFNKGYTFNLASGSTLNLSKASFAGDLTVNVNGGTVNLSGATLKGGLTVNLDGGTLDLSTSKLTANSLTVNGSGTLNVGTRVTATEFCSTASVTLNNVTIKGAGIDITTLVAMKNAEYAIENNCTFGSLTASVVNGIVVLGADYSGSLGGLTEIDLGTHKLTLNVSELSDLTIKNGTVVVNGDLAIKNTVKFENVNLSVGNLTIGPDRTLELVNSTVTVTGAINTSSANNKGATIRIEGSTVSVSGAIKNASSCKITVTGSTVSASSIENKGELTVNTSTVTVTGTVSNTGILTSSGTTFNFTGTANYCFNNAGGRINISTVTINISGSYKYIVYSANSTTNISGNYSGSVSVGVAYTGLNVTGTVSLKQVS